MVALGRFAASWKIPNRDENWNQESLRRVGDACPNLQECVLHLTGLQSLTFSAFGTLFVVPKLMLRSFDVCITKLTQICTILEVLAAQVDSLEKFKYKGPFPGSELLQGFVRSQKKLKKVTLYSRGQRCMCPGDAARASEKQMAPIWIKIVSVFFESRSLQEIVCECCSYIMTDNGYGGRAVGMAEFCSLHRSRRVSVSVCGVQHM